VPPADSVPPQQQRYDEFRIRYNFDEFRILYNNERAA
jgi:hypothetical protein